MSVLNWLEQERKQAVKSVKQLAGLTACSQLVELENGEKYVLRHQSQRATDYGVNYQQEFRLLELLQSLEFAPKPYHSTANETLLHWIEGDIPSAFSPTLLEKLAKQLARLHTFPLQAEGFDKKIAKLALAERCHFLWSKLTPQKRQELSFSPPFEYISPLDYAICHHDIHLGNLVEQGENLYLIDWEYAAISDPALDIAMLFHANRLSHAEQTHFLHTYLAHTPYSQREFEQQIQRYLPEVNKLSLLWYAL